MAHHSDSRFQVSSGQLFLYNTLKLAGRRDAGDIVWKARIPKREFVTRTCDCAKCLDERFASLQIGSGIVDEITPRATKARSNGLPCQQIGHLPQRKGFQVGLGPRERSDGAAVEFARRSAREAPTGDKDTHRL